MINNNDILAAYILCRFLTESKDFEQEVLSCHDLLSGVPDIHPSISIIIHASARSDYDKERILCCIYFSFRFEPYLPLNTFYSVEFDNPYEQHNKLLEYMLAPLVNPKPVWLAEAQAKLLEAIKDGY